MKTKIFFAVIFFLSVFSYSQSVLRQTLFMAYAEHDDAAYQWPFNSRYNKQDSGCFSYAAVAYSPFVILKNDTESVKINPPASYFIDTVYVAIGHLNTSGKNDTIIFKITDVDKNNKPGKNILWSATIIKNKSLSKNGDWRNEYTHILYEPKVEIKGGKCFALTFEYYGDKKDTLGLRALYKQDTIKNKIASINGTVYPAQMPVYKNSNWLCEPNIGNEIISSDRKKSGNKKMLSPIQHWDFYVRIRVPK